MYTLCSRIALTVATETMHFFIMQLSLSLHFWGPNEQFGIHEKLSLVGGGGGEECKVGQISSRGITDLLCTAYTAVCIYTN